tara:strand:- start:198 stop:536 length:339 start_codon:yes stop_codon:yes gene_type:complete
MIVKTVTITEKKYPLYFGFNALRIYCTKAGKSLKELDQIGQNMDLNDAVCLIWSGLKDGARKTKKDFNLSVDDLSDEFDSDMDAIGRCLEVFSEFQSKQVGKSGKLKAGAKK